MVRPILRDRCPVCLSVTLVLSPNGWMDQDATWYWGRGDIVLDGDPDPPRKGAQQPLYFSAHVYCGQKVAHLSYGWALVPSVTACSCLCVSRSARRNFVNFSGGDSHWYKERLIRFRGSPQAKIVDSVPLAIFATTTRRAENSAGIRTTSISLGLLDWCHSMNILATFKRFWRSGDAGNFQILSDSRASNGVAD